MAQVAQRGDGCPISGDSQGQAGGALSTDGAVGVPVHCREWDQMAFKGPFQLKPFYDSVEKKKKQPKNTTFLAQLLYHLNWNQ